MSQILRLLDRLNLQQGKSAKNNNNLNPIKKI